MSTPASPRTEQTPPAPVEPDESPSEPRPASRLADVMARVGAAATASHSGDVPF